jgi:hypothetical protein
MAALGQKEFSKLPTSIDSTFGYKDKNPLKLKKGNLEKSIAYSLDFLKRLTTVDNQQLELLMRYTVKDPNYNRPKKFN